MLKPEYIFLWILFHLGAVELPKRLSDRNKPKLPVTEDVKFLRYQSALQQYTSVNSIKYPIELKSLAIALWKTGNTDSAAKIYDVLSYNYPQVIVGADLLNMALIQRSLGNYHVADSLIFTLKQGEFSYAALFEEYNDSNFFRKSNFINAAIETTKVRKSAKGIDISGAVLHPVTRKWYYQDRAPVYDGLLTSISSTDEKPFGRIMRADVWNDSLVDGIEPVQKTIINRYLELSYIDSQNNYYVTANNKFVNDSDQFLLQVYSYSYNPKTSKYALKTIGLESYQNNVSSFVLNSNRTKAMFCSDMPGTLGKADVWICDVTWNENGEPKIQNITNLGNKVNTILSEADPTFITDDVIAFASEGRTGYGGQDIYFYCFSTNEVTNAGKIINTKYNDYFPRYESGQFYYSSAREDKLSKIYQVGLPYDAIYNSVQPIYISTPVPDFVEPKEVESVVVIKTKDAVETTLQKVKEESSNKYDYAKNLSFVLMADSERLAMIDHMDSNANYKDYKFMTLFHVDGDFVIEKEFEKELTIISALLKKKSDWGLEIRSYTDSRGTKISNQKLSQGRADYVAKFLQMQGVNLKQLKPVGYGETLLLNHCADGVPCTEEEHRQNRRTELILMPVKYWKKKNGL